MTKPCPIVTYMQIHVSLDNNLNMLNAIHKLVKVSIYGKYKVETIFIQMKSLEKVKTYYIIKNTAFKQKYSFVVIKG